MKNKVFYEVWLLGFDENGFATDFEYEIARPTNVEDALVIAKNHYECRNEFILGNPTLLRKIQIEKPFMISIRVEKSTIIDENTKECSVDTIQAYDIALEY